MSAFAELATLVPQQIWNGVVGRVVHGERVTLATVELDADSEIPEHSHENEQVGMIIAGSLTFRVGGETRELGPAAAGASWRTSRTSCTPAPTARSWSRCSRRRVPIGRPSSASRPVSHAGHIQPIADTSPTRG